MEDLIKKKKINFTQERIENLALPKKGRVDYYDSKVTKLTCRVSASGNKSFVVLKKNMAGKSQRVTLGRFPDMTVSTAQKLASTVLAELSSGINPTEEKRKQRLKGMTLQELFNIYIDAKTELKDSSILDYNKKLNQGFSDWLNKPINTITREMVMAKRKQFKGGRDNKLRVLRFLMRYAVKPLKVLNENPVDVVTEGKHWKKPTRKTRNVPSDNLKGWHEAVLNLKNEKAKVYLLILLHTGLRESDVRYLEWADIDFRHDSLIARDTKNGMDFKTYIAPQIKPHLTHLQTMTGDNKYVFPGKTADGVMGIPKKPIADVCKAAKVIFSPHDLKRTFVTIGEAAYIPDSLLKALANHKTDGDVTDGYKHPEKNTLKQAINQIADKIEEHILKPTPQIKV